MRRLLNGAFVLGLWWSSTPQISCWPPIAGEHFIDCLIICRNGSEKDIIVAKVRIFVGFSLCIPSCLFGLAASRSTNEGCIFFAHSWWDNIRTANYDKWIVCCLNKLRRHTVMKTASLLVHPLFYFIFLLACFWSFINSFKPIRSHSLFLYNI